MKIKRIISVVLIITLIMAMNISTVFAYGKGNGNIPPGLAKKGGMPPGLMKKLFNNVDKDEVLGQIYRIDDDSIFVLVDDEITVIPVSQNVIVYSGSQRINYSDIEVDSFVRIVLTDGIVSYIEIVENNNSEKIISRYNGEVVRINNDETDVIAIKIKQMVVIFEVRDDAKIIFEDGEGFLDEIKIGDGVTILVDKYNRARKIHVYRERKHSSKLEGEITELDLQGIYHITINDERYVISEEVEVEIDGEEAELEDLELGMKAGIEIREDKVIKIKAEAIEEVEGEITELDLQGIYHITIDDKRYVVSEKAEVEIDREESELKDLELGMNAEIEIREDKVIKINANNNKFTIEGEIKQITKLNTSYKITIEVDNKDVEYALSSNVTIKDDDDENLSVEDLDVGEEGIFEVINNSIVEIIIED